MRIDYFQHKPEWITRLRELTREQESFSIDPRLRALVELRVSQVNGCGYCVDLHAREARDRGESQQRLDALPVWHDSPFFSDREKSALAWAESLTRISDTHAGDAEFDAVRRHFTEQEAVELSLSVSLANFWNRVAGGFRRQPQAR
jgi:AhpD family alkylhydroperoxidase